MRKDTPEYVKGLAKELRKTQTVAEQKLWDRLRAERFHGYKFKRQYCVGRYIVDFYCSEARLVIEVDGKIHEQEERIEYDTIREQDILTRNVKILRFTNEQILNDINNVLKDLYHILQTCDSQALTPLS